MLLSLLCPVSVWLVRPLLGLSNMCVVTLSLSARSALSSEKKKLFSSVSIQKLLRLCGAMIAGAGAGKTGEHWDLLTLYLFL